MKPTSEQPTESTPESTPASAPAPVGMLHTLEQFECWIESDLANLELRYRDFWTNESAWVSMGNRKSGRR